MRPGEEVEAHKSSCSTHPSKDMRALGVLRTEHDDKRPAKDKSALPHLYALSSGAYQKLHSTQEAIMRQKQCKPDRPGCPRC